MTPRHPVMVGAFAVTVALLIVATPLQGARHENVSFSKPDSLRQTFRVSSTSARFGQSREASYRASKPVESSYYYGGKLVKLERSASELSVRFAATASRSSRRDLVVGYSRSARMSRASNLRGRDLSTVAIGGKSSASFSRLLAGLDTKRDVDFAYPVWIDPKTGSRLLLTDELIVHLSAPASAETRDAFAARGLTIEREIAYSSQEYVLRLLNPKESDPLAISRELYESGLAEWAEPNFVQEIEKDFAPNDPLFPQQWHLLNTGQDGGTANADARLTGAWDVEKGSPNTTIAVIDDGVQLNHPDLAQNIYTNPGEIPGNRIDDDHNGFVDDIHGWNFVFGTNKVRPVGSGEEGDEHGTAVAGVAAARGNNDKGVSGACPQCTILPVKIASDGIWATDSQIADAIRYAGRMADVINISWGSDEPLGVLNSALRYAVKKGRDGKGTVVLAASGNSASGVVRFTLAQIPPGTYRFRWMYSKNLDDFYNVGADSAWLSWVLFPDGEFQTFQPSSDLPLGWTTGGSAPNSAPWSIVDDPAHADEGRCWLHAAKSGKISNDEETHIDVVKTFSKKGDLDFLGFDSSEAGMYYFINGQVAIAGLDGLSLWVDQGDDGTWEFVSDLFSGVPPAGLSYPAADPQVIAVGASTSFDCQAPYSQYGSALALVAPSSGGDLTDAIMTTDRTGKAGYDPTSDYFSGFGGTSSAAPLAAGITGLILSKNPGLTQAQVRQILESSADKIRPNVSAYDSRGHSERFGYGRINAEKAVHLTPFPSKISLSKPRYRVREGGIARIRIKREGTLGNAVFVKLKTIGRSARAGRDFTGITRKVYFAPGKRIKTISIRIKADDVRESSETLSLELSKPSAGAILAGPSTSKLTIADVGARSRDAVPAAHGGVREQR
ncbi:MAG: S8 family serine peptidase [Gaiellaceae bacterium]